MPVTVAVVQMAINPKMPRINHPMSHLDHQSSLVSSGRQVLPRDPLSRDSFFEETGIKYTFCNLYKSQNVESY